VKFIIVCVMQDGLRPEIVNEDGDYSVVRVHRPLADVIATNCDLIRDAVHGLIETYCHAFRVDFQLNSRAELPTSELFCLSLRH
jgi:phosphatidylinositol-4-phosphate 3-kinase